MGEFKGQFRERPIVQFTATPFRTDGKRIGGKFIYSYPLARAQKEGYFRAVSFSPIEEFDPGLSDRAIARRAGKLLQDDIGCLVVRSALFHRSVPSSTRDQR